MKANKLSARIAKLRACPHCNETGGLWDNAAPGRRCPNPHCLKGMLLAKADAIREGRLKLEQELEYAELAHTTGQSDHEVIAA